MFPPRARWWEPRSKLRLVLGVSQVPKVPRPQAVLAPLKAVSGATDPVVGEAIVKALIVTDLAYCVLIREPVWRVSGIRLP
jgi:hypothetical protein